MDVGKSRGQLTHDAFSLKPQPQGMGQPVLANDNDQQYSLCQTKMTTATASLALPSISQPIYLLPC